MEDPLRSLLDSWPLGRVLSVTRAAGGATNRVFRVELSSRAVFLRIYQKADRATALREHALIGHVRGRGVPAAQPIPARDGSTLVEREGLRCALYEAASGQQIHRGELSLEQASSAGDMLALLHRTARELPGDGFVRWNLSWDGPAWAERLASVERAILSAGVACDTDEWALRRVREQRRWLADPACPHAHEPACARQVIHGDFQLANLFFDGSNVSAIIDWEQAAFMPPAYEVARAASFMFATERELTRAFREAYLAQSHMDSTELTDGARAWACFHDHHVWALEEAYLKGNTSARQYIPHLPFRPFLDAWNETL